jgi:hypothetical protein
MKQSVKSFRKTFLRKANHINRMEQRMSPMCIKELVFYGDFAEGKRSVASGLAVIYRACRVVEVLRVEKGSLQGDGQGYLWHQIGQSCIVSR